VRREGLGKFKISPHRVSNPQQTKNKMGLQKKTNRDFRNEYSPADATPARNREVLVVRTLGTLHGDGWSGVLLLLPLSTPLLTGVEVALRVIKRCWCLMGKPPRASREPYSDAICWRRSSLYRAIRSARCCSVSHEPEVRVPSRARAFDGKEAFRSLKIRYQPLVIYH
jgi:hypothetical protein